MKKRAYYKFMALTSCALAIFVQFSCNRDKTDNTYLESYINEFFSQGISHQPLKSESLCLYVDYSTCIAQGQESPFYQALVPTWTDNAKEYWSIKGNQIAREQGDTYTLLRSINEVNYADLKTAAETIVAGNKEAVLLTDGEYYQRSIAKGNINNPYMADAFKTWLLKGYEIFILAEPYQEKYRGAIKSKKRFYFIFTDPSLPNNIFQQLSKNVTLSKYPKVKLFHLTAAKLNPDLNKFSISSEAKEILNADVTKKAGYEIQEWHTTWKMINKYIMHGYNEETGEPLPMGNPVFTGLKINKDAFEGYTIEDINFNVYDMNEGYRSYFEQQSAIDPANEAGDVAPTDKMTSPKIVKAEHFLIYDKEQFDKDGSVNIYFERPESFDPTPVSWPLSFIKVDIASGSVKNSFMDSDELKEMFSFDSIDVPGETNVSILESVKLCLNESDVIKRMTNQPLYSIYIVTPNY